MEICSLDDFAPQNHAWSHACVLLRRILYEGKRKHARFKGATHSQLLLKCIIPAMCCNPFEGCLPFVLKNGRLRTNALMSKALSFSHSPARPGVRLSPRAGGPACLQPMVPTPTAPSHRHDRYNPTASTATTRSLGTVPSRQPVPCQRAGGRFRSPLPEHAEEGSQPLGWRGDPRRWAWRHLAAAQGAASRRRGPAWRRGRGRGRGAGRRPGRRGEAGGGAGGTGPRQPAAAVWLGVVRCRRLPPPGPRFTTEDRLVLLIESDAETIVASRVPSASCS